MHFQVWKEEKEEERAVGRRKTKRRKEVRDQADEPSPLSILLPSFLFPLIPAGAFPHPV